MLSGKHLREEIEKIEAVLADPKATANDIAKAQLKATTLGLKLDQSLRANSVAVMKFFKVPMATKKDDEVQE